MVEEYEKAGKVKRDANGFLVLPTGDSIPRGTSRSQPLKERVDAHLQTLVTAYAVYLQNTMKVPISAASPSPNSTSEGSERVTTLLVEAVPILDQSKDDFDVLARKHRA